MIDIEIDIYNIVRRAVEDEMGKGMAEVSTEYTKQPAKFPFVSVIEVDNASSDWTRTSDNVENHATVTYDINIYSNRVGTRKSECKRIANAVDTAMLRLGFSRMSMGQNPNLMDTTVYRITGRYRAMVDHNKTIYYRR